VKFKELGVSNSLLWFLISAFLCIWLGEQLFGAITDLEIMNLRVTNIVSMKDNPIWFIVVCILKLVVWVLSVIVLYKYLHTKFSVKGT